MNFLKTKPSTELPDLDLTDALTLAEDSDTHPDVLSHLATSILESVPAAVAANPNTPESVLFHLWVKHPAALLIPSIQNSWT